MRPRWRYDPRAPDASRRIHNIALARSLTAGQPARGSLPAVLGAAQGRDLDPLVVVLQDLLRRFSAECHPLRAPLRHSNTVPVALAGEDETRRQPVLPAEDAERVDR